jgi:hypothetical protein
MCQALEVEKFIQNYIQKSQMFSSLEIRDHKCHDNIKMKFKEIESECIVFILEVQ